MKALRQSNQKKQRKTNKENKTSKRRRYQPTNGNICEDIKKKGNKYYIYI